jgi:hypothetical protein
MYAEKIRQQQDRLRVGLAQPQSAALPPVSQAVDLVALTAKAAELFLQQPRRNSENSFGSS